MSASMVAGAAARPFTAVEPQHGAAAGVDSRSRSLRFLFALLAALAPTGCRAAGPRGSIVATATQSRQYILGQVQVSYFEPVNCTVEFDQDVNDMQVSFFTKDETTSIMNLESISASIYTFQVNSSRSGNVSIFISPNTIRNAGGVFNEEATASFSFVFYAEAPSVSLNVEGYESTSTNREENTVYLVFSSPLSFDVFNFFSKSDVAIKPDYEVNSFQMISPTMFRIRFKIEKNETAEASEVQCADPNSTSSSDDAIARYNCSMCPRSQRCTSNTSYPPSGVPYLEFPLEVHLGAIPDLAMPNQTLAMVYDTLWPEVSLYAETYAKAPFTVIVTWTEPLKDLRAIVPSIGITGPPVDLDLMVNNLTILSPSSVQLLISPSATGIVPIFINGTQNSKDLAGNSNDFRRNPASRTGDFASVVFSAGPPLEGVLSFDYSRPPASFEFNPQASPPGGALVVPSLTISWSGFITATEYDLWITWGKNLSVAANPKLTGDSFRFSEFRALLGVEYSVYVRAWNIWGENTVVSRVFVHPQINVVADGTYSILRLPDLLSQLQTNVSMHLLIPDHGFMSIDPLKVLSLRSANRAEGDEDPCRVNSNLRECTFMSFHIEVPNAHFVVFKKPIRLQFVFGQDGWEDIYFRPKLHYWESNVEQWWSVTGTCPPEQVYDTWNEKLRIYEVSLCHLSLFTIFATFSPPSPTQAPPVPERPASYTDPALFIVLGGLAVAMVLLCCVCYWACIHNPAATPEKRALSYSEMGIRPVSDRLPSRRRSGQKLGGQLALQDKRQADEVLRLMPAVPQPQSPSSTAVGAALALEDKLTEVETAERTQAEEAKPIINPSGVEEPDPESGVLPNQAPS